MSSATVSPSQVLQQLNWRYATKKFDPTKKIPPEIWKTLEDSLVLAPSSFGLQPWKFIVVSNPDIRQQLVQHSWGQTQVVDASHLVVLAIQKELSAADVDRYVQHMSVVRQVEVDALQGLANMIKGFLSNPSIDLNDWAARQVYIALGQFMTAAAMLGIDTCPMEGFNPALYDEVLGLTEQGYSAVVLCPAGYRAADDKYAAMPKVRYPNQDVVQYVL